MPWRHSAIVDSFQNHVGPANDLVIVVHGERTDLSGAMAIDTILFENWRDMFCVGNCRLYRRFFDPSDKAARGLSNWNAHRFSLNQLGQRNLQIVARRF